MKLPSKLEDPHPRYEFTRRSRGGIGDQNKPIALAAIPDEPPTSLGPDYELGMVGVGLRARR